MQVNCVVFRWLRCMSRKCGFVDWITITLTGLSMESAVQFVIFAILSHTEIYCSVAKWREGGGGWWGVTWLEQPCTQSICAAKQTIDVTKGAAQLRPSGNHLHMNAPISVSAVERLVCMLLSCKSVHQLKTRVRLYFSLSRGVIIKLTYVHTVSSSSSTSIICRSHSAAGVVEIINVYHEQTNQINIVENESNAPNKIIGYSL